MDKQELVDFLRENLKIKLEESDMYVNRKSIKVELVLTVDGKDETIDSDTISI